MREAIMVNRKYFTNFRVTTITTGIRMKYVGKDLFEVKVYGVDSVFRFRP